MLVANILNHYDGNLMIIGETTRKTLFNSYASGDIAPDAFLYKVSRIEVKSDFMIIFINEGKDDE